MDMGVVGLYRLRLLFLLHFTSNVHVAITPLTVSHVLKGVSVAEYQTVERMTALHCHWIICNQIQALYFHVYMYLNNYHTT